MIRCYSTALCKLVPGTPQDTLYEGRTYIIEIDIWHIGFVFSINFYDSVNKRTNYDWGTE